MTSNVQNVKSRCVRTLAIVWSTAAYPCFGAANVAIYTTGSTFYYLFKERIIIRGHVSLLATFNIAAAAATAVACPCTPPAKTGPLLLLLSSIPSRSSEISRKGIPTCNLHSRYSLVDFTFAIVLSSDLPYEGWRSASLRETKNTPRLKIDLSATALKTVFFRDEWTLYYFSIAENISLN